ncbi:MAG: carboxypeptidase-like regulatory domain-containing protein [Polyangiaceae bacterium]
MRRSRWIMCSLPLAALGCSSSQSSSAAPSDGGLAIPPDAYPATCMPGIDGGTCVLGAQGRVTDLDGVPLPHLVMTFCGTACFGATSDDAGVYYIPIGFVLDTQNYAVHADGRPDHGVDYLRLQAGEPSIVTKTMRIPLLPPSQVRLPPDEAGAPTSVTEGDLTLMVAAGTTFDLDIEDYEKGDVGRTLRVAQVPLDKAPAYAAAANLAAIYALAPSGAKPSSKMGVMLRNTAGLPPSSAVDFMVLGDDYFSMPPDVGELAVQAEGHVSADGQIIQTDPGEGIVELTWLGVRAKQ